MNLLCTTAFVLFCVLGGTSFATEKSAADAFAQNAPGKSYTYNWRREITDADFFGSFREGSWVAKPMLDYAHSRELKGVEAAAKAGNYEQAGIELLAHFKKRPSEPMPERRAGTSLDNRLRKDLFVGMNYSPVAEIDVAPQPGDYEVAMPAGQIRKGMMTFQLMGRHKNGVVSHVSSRESDHPIMLELTLKDGTTQKIAVHSDSYVRPGEFEKMNFGGEKTLEVCDSGLKAGKPFDGDTRWALMTFDLTKITPAQIKGARLRFHAWSDTADQKLLLITLDSTIVDEKNITWNNNLGYVYSFEGLSGGVDWDMPRGSFGQLSRVLLRLYWFRQAAAHAISSTDPEAATTAFALIRDFITDFPKLKFSGKEINDAGRIDAYALALPRLFKLDACKPRDCVEIMKAVVRDGTTLYINRRQIDSGNMAVTMVDSMVTGATAFPELADSKLWLGAAAKRLENILNTSVLEDGSYTEHNFGYAFNVLGQMLALQEGLAATGVEIPKALPRKTHELARYLMFCSLPNGITPYWGSAPGNSQNDASSKRAASYFNDPEMLWWISQGKTGHAPKVLDVSYPANRIGLLRSSWEVDAQVLFFSSKIGGGHDHVDQNAVVLHAYGHSLLHDTGMTTYSAHHPHFDWQQNQTRSHNTVEVDERGFPRLKEGEMPAASELAVFTAAPAKLMESWADGYPNVRHQRSIFLHKQADIYFVADWLTPKDENAHTYDQCWHIDPSNTYQSDARTGRVWTTNRGAVNLEILPVFPQKTELLLRKGFNAQPLQETIHPSFRQKITGNAEFLTILRPTRPGQTARNLNPRLLNATAGARAVKITTDEGEGILILSHQGGTARAGEMETDARCAYAQFDQTGKVKWAVRHGGNMVRVGGKEVEGEAMMELAPPSLP